LNRGLEASPRWLAKRLSHAHIGSSEFPGGAVRLAEVHWYEGHGIGKKEIKIKFYLD